MSEWERKPTKMREKIHLLTREALRSSFSRTTVSFKDRDELEYTNCVWVTRWVRGANEMNDNWTEWTYALWRISWAALLDSHYWSHAGFTLLYSFCHTVSPFLDSFISPLGQRVREKERKRERERERSRAETWRSLAERRVIMSAMNYTRSSLSLNPQSKLALAHHPKQLDRWGQFIRSSSSSVTLSFLFSSPHLFFFSFSMM